MRINLTVLACIALSWSVSAHADQASDQAAEFLAQFDQGDGKLDLEKVQSFYEKTKLGSMEKAHSAVAISPEGKPYAQPKEGEQPTGIHAQLLIRKSFTDVFLFDRPTPAASAAGAQISYSNDNIADDEVWSLHGMIALPIGYDGTYGSVIGASIAPYVEFNADNHSNADSARTIELGATGEIGFDMGDWSSYFRGRIGVVNDDIDDYTNVASSLEWIPVSGPLCLDFPCNIPGTPIIFRFQPSLLLQYDDVTSGLSPFSGDDNALRLGPVFTLNFQPFGPGETFWDRLVGNVSYHIATEFNSGETFDWLDSSLTYNLTPEGNLGLTATYQYGEDEKTADETDKFLISLSGKL